MEPGEEPAPRPVRDLRRRSVRARGTRGPVDLSQVTSPYVDQTASHLDRVLAAAEEHGALLVVDEADALFGRRSDVASAHDRYAAPEPSPPEGPPDQPSTNEP